MFCSGLKFCALALCVALFSTSCGGGGGGQVAPDTDGPQINIVGIANGQQLSGSVSLTINASDPSGVSALKLHIAGHEVAQAAGGQINWFWNTASTAAGSCEVSAIATDQEGNSASHSINVEIQAAAAEDPVLLPSQPASNSDAAEIFPILSGPPPAFYEPSDVKLPQPLVSGLRDGQRVSGRVNFDVSGVDNRSVEAVRVMAGDSQQWYSDSTSLSISWDTTRSAEGPLTMHIYLLDRGLHVTHTELEVIVSNFSDHLGPQIVRLDTDVSYGDLDLSFEASDESKISSMKLYLSWFDDVVHPYWELPRPPVLAAEVNGGSRLSYHWQAGQAPAAEDNVRARFTVEATDELGNQTRLNGEVTRYNSIDRPLLLTRERAQLRLANNFRLEFQRLSDAGQFGLPYTAKFSLDAYQGTNFSLPIFDLADLSPAGPAPVAGLPPGTYQISLQADDYVYSVQRRVLVGWEKEIKLEPPLLYKELRLPGMRFNPEEGADRHDLRLEGSSDPMYVARQTTFGFDPWEGKHGYPMGKTKQDWLEELQSSDPPLNNIDHIWIGTESDSEAGFFSAPDASQNLRDWIRDGGVLLVSGTAYDYVEQLFPSMLDFAGGQPGSGLSSEAEPLDAAEIGEWQQGTTYLLNHVTCDLPSFPDAAVQDGFPVIEAVNQQRVHVWLNMRPDLKKTQPLLVSFEYGLGRVWLSLLPFSTGSMATESWEEPDQLGGVLEAVFRKITQEEHMPDYYYDYFLED